MHANKRKNKNIKPNGPGQDQKSMNIACVINFSKRKDNQKKKASALCQRCNPLGF